MESNSLHHTNLYSNHSIEPHHGELTSRQMNDQTLNEPQAKLNIIKMEDLYDTHNYRVKQFYPDTISNPKCK
jgi:hypothetical protein